MGEDFVCFDLNIQILIYIYISILFLKRELN